MTNKVKISAAEVKNLRKKTGASVMECRRALAQCGGNFEKAVDYLRKRGSEEALKKAERETSEGVIAAYIHSDKKIGAMVELLCETDFVARNSEFQELAHDLAMHIAAMDPKYLSPEEVSEKSGVEGEIPLLTQPFIKNQDITIDDLVKEKITKLGENIQIRNFVRFKI